MNVLIIKRKLIDEFQKRNNTKDKNNVQIVPFKDLNINIEKETYDWYSYNNGGDEFE